MMFLTLFFMFLAVYSLLKGKLFYNHGIENAKFEIEKAKGTVTKMSSDLAAKTTFLGLFALFYLTSLLVYVVKALYLDPFILPTISFIIFSMLNSIVSSSLNKKDLTTEEGRMVYLVQTKKRHTFKAKITQLLHLSYFVYMFMVLLDLVK